MGWKLIMRLYGHDKKRGDNHHDDAVGNERNRGHSQTLTVLLRDSLRNLTLHEV